MASSFAFRGTLIRKEDGAVTVTADTAEEAIECLDEGEWEELHSYGGETSFEWDGQPPEPI